MVRCYVSGRERKAHPVIKESVFERKGLADELCQLPVSRFPVLGRRR